MVNDRASAFNLYSTYGVTNVVAYRGEFQHPWFFDTFQHKLMQDFSDEFIHLKALKTGDIFQLRLIDEVPKFCKPGILITSTLKDTVFVINTKNISFHHTTNKYSKGQKAQPSRTSYSGIIRYGGYILKQHETFFQHLRDLDIDFPDSSLAAIRDELERRKKIYEALRNS